MSAENHESIQDLYRKLHDREILIDQMHARLERLEARLNRQEEQVENLNQGIRKYY